jgi:hypothetical protein
MAMENDNSGRVIADRKLLTQTSGIKELAERAAIIRQRSEYLREKSLRLLEQSEKLSKRFFGYDDID